MFTYSVTPDGSTRNIFSMVSPPRGLFAVNFIVIEPTFFGRIINARDCAVLVGTLTDFLRYSLISEKIWFISAKYTSTIALN